MTNFYKTLIGKITDLEQNSRLRTMKTIEKRDGNHIWIEGKKYLNCSSNDYLGIAADIELKKEFLDWCAQNSESLSTDLSSSSSRLLSGNSFVYEKTERQIAQLYCKEECVIFSSGYHMNAGFFAAMYEKGDLIVADKLIHASIVDGMLLSRADHIRYNHLDTDHLRKILNLNRAKYRSVIIVTESIFSMDGDMADLNELTKIAELFNAQLFVDEAHAVGCIGATGLGLCETTKTTKRIDFIAGTFGKAVGGAGAFIVCSKETKSMLINKCRSFIFTTALPPLNISWISFVFEKIPKMGENRQRLDQIGCFFKQELQKNGFTTIGASHIVPLIIGDDCKTVGISSKMKEAGFFVPAIRPPTVPDGTSRLRFSLTSEFCEYEISSMIGLLKSIY